MTVQSRVGPRSIIFLVALVLRLGWILLRGADGLRYSDDARAYNDLAMNLVENHRFVTVMDAPHRSDSPYAQRPPLTPFFLAAVYTIFGPHLAAAQITLAILGALTALLVFELGRRLFGDRIALVAGILTAAYPFFVFLAAVPSLPI